MLIDVYIIGIRYTYRCLHRLFQIRLSTFCQTVWALIIPMDSPEQKLASWESGVEENARTIPKHWRWLNHDEPSASYMSRSRPTCLKCSHFYIRYKINNHFSCFHMFRYICLCHILQLFKSAFYMLRSAILGLASSLGLLKTCVYLYRQTVLAPQPIQTCSNTQSFVTASQTDEWF